LRIQDIEDAVRRQNIQHTPVAVNREGLAFPQVQQARDMVDIRIGQDHGGDRAAALGSVAQRLQLPAIIDLLAKIRRRVQDYPSQPVGADGDRRLGQRSSVRVAPSCSPGRFIVAIPLGKAAAGGCTQHQRMKHGL